MDLERFYRRYQRDIESTSKFIQWLEEESPQVGKPTIEWGGSDFSFRIVTGGFDPLSIEGTLAYGGRFNIGGAQVAPQFPAYSIEGMLYAADTRACAYSEVGDLLGVHGLYCLRSKKTLLLWDLELLLAEYLPFPNLKSEIDSTPLDAIWVYQKIPKISQILGSYLRRQGGDGIIYPSTKDPSGRTLAIFAKDNHDMRKLFIL